MSELQRCKSCDGVYAPLQADGTDYYHACPPIVRIEVLRGAVLERVQLADLLPTDRIKVRRGNVVVDIPVSAMLPDDVRASDIVEDRGNARDENRADVGGVVEGNRRIKASGDGVEAIP